MAYLSQIKSIKIVFFFYASSNLNESLREIERLRNQLIRTLAIRENNLNSKRALSVDTFKLMDHHQSNKAMNEEKSTNPLYSLVSPRNEWPNDNFSSDSGLLTQKSDMTINSNSTNIQQSNVQGCKFLSSNNLFVPSDPALENYSRDDLLSLLKQLSNENLLLKKSYESMLAFFHISHSQ